MQKQSLTIKPLFRRGHHPKALDLRVRQLICRQTVSPVKVIPTVLPTANLWTIGVKPCEPFPNKTQKHPGKPDSTGLSVVNVCKSIPFFDVEWRPQGKPQPYISCGLQRETSRFTYDFAYSGIWRGVVA